MRICQRHWDMLRKAITDRGLEHLGARNGQEAVAAMATELEGRGAENDYDPLMSCNWMIFSRALELGGLGVMTPDDTGRPRCPVCMAMESSQIGGEGGFRDKAHVESHWIDGPADAALSLAREKGLVPR